MAKPDAPKERSTMDEKSRSDNAKTGNDQVRRESSVQYRNSIEKINRSQDRDIERALRH
jgi:basic membrane lipoprotein Med (substrate-binding protein (PBP1-ABC) superfamily)